jgi:predicted metalloprotease with PDZ domain
VPLAGITRAGYRLVWKDEPNRFDKARMDNSKGLNLYHSLGLSLDKDGAITATRWNGPAFSAGLVTSAKIVAVNGVAYYPERLKKAITDAKGGHRPIELLVRRGDRFVTVQVPYSGGLRWPWLEPISKGVQGLDRLLAPRRGATAP